MRNLSEINASALHVGLVMDLLGVSMTDLSFNDRFQKVKFVAEFVKDAPNVERFFGRLPKAGVPGTNKLDFFYEYCHQKGLRSEVMRKYLDLEQQWIQFGEEGLVEEMEAALGEVREIDSVIDTYER